jgi:hypothetical protein
METCQPITADDLRQKLFSRWLYLQENELHNGKYREESKFLDEAVTEVFQRDIDVENQKATDNVLCNIAVKSSKTGENARVEAGVSPRLLSSPDILTGGYQCSFHNSPLSPLTEVPKQGGYDGGVTLGFDGVWSESKFTELLKVLETAKIQASEQPTGVFIQVGGQTISVAPSGAKGELYYKYIVRFASITMSIHHNPQGSIQPIRVRYGAEALMVNHLSAVHQQVCDWLAVVGFTISEEKLSRVDMQVMTDVSMIDFMKLIFSEHLVTKFHHRKCEDTLGQLETYTVGSSDRVQICIYDKRKEISKSDLVKLELFINYCVGNEWYNSNRPITRIELRLGRIALSKLGVDSVRDLLEREKAIANLITYDWFRLLEKPKVRGCENEAKLHPLWIDVRQLFFKFFSNNTVSDVEWKKPDPLVCNPEALVKQATGCLSKAVASRFGAQKTKQQVIAHVSTLIEPLAEKMVKNVNEIVIQTKVLKGIDLGASECVLINESVVTQSPVPDCEEWTG